MTVAELAGRVAGVLPDPADELQVAAVLESQGITDQAAVEVYGVADVFELARRVYDRLPREPGPAPGAGARDPRSWYDVAHGPLYLAPAAAYPALATALGAPAAVRVLVLATTVGWLWGAGAGWAAHRVRRSGAGRAAGRLLRVLAVAGLALAAVGALVLLPPGGGPAPALFAVVLTAYQIASGILVFYRREPLVLLVALPAVLGGAVHLLRGRADDVPVLLFGFASAAAALGLALLATLGAEDAVGVRPPGARVLVLGALPGVGYAALCAAFLLHTDVRFVGGALDLAVAMAPLALGMGVVEWRANRVFEQVGELLREARPTAWFRDAVWRLLLRELATCLLVLGALALVLLVCLGRAGLLTSRGALLVDAHVVLGGAFFLGFVLARTGCLARLLAVLAGVLVANVVLAGLVADAWAPDAHVPVFLVCCTALSLLMLSALRASVGDVHHYR
ncbi:hypothetical protein [Saccharothrix syringae]|uniref:Uncharacterized protein n=1 Tax=Saccharothrix syringae TaxID=103733 RepID=A0A5Q0GWN8_SACSY|nr:hypothetical protein [Saccharothrix syringae]QFZ18351.1 hypothetical protein EKG83_13430 [Saccharothrix syringae]